MPKEGLVDGMTPKERVKALLEGRPYDRIPCLASIGDHAALVVGIKVSEFSLSSRDMARGIIAAYRTYGDDGVGIGQGRTVMAEALGSRVSYPDYGSPYVDEYVIKDRSDLKKLQIPDPRKSGRLPLFLETLEILMDELAEEVSVSLNVGGPLSLAASLRGTDTIMRDFFKAPDFVHQLLDFCVESAVPFIQEGARLGARFRVSDPVSSGSVISPSQFREFSFPYIRRLVDEIKQVSTPPTLHICGNTRKIWNEMADTGAASLSLDNVIDLAEAKREVGYRIAISGNVRPTDTMYLGTPETVEENVKECLRKAYDSPKGYFLAMGCGLPILTPPGNIHAFVRAARKFGKYPYDPSLFT